MIAVALGMTPTGVFTWPGDDHTLSSDSVQSWDRVTVVVVMGMT